MNGEGLRPQGKEFFGRGGILGEGRGKNYKYRFKCRYLVLGAKTVYISMKIHLCIMGVWALKLAPGAWYCAVMCYSRRCSCGQTSAVIGLNLGAILHARGKMVRRNLRLGGKAGIPSRICASG
jgi:hypothetical protein